MTGPHLSPLEAESFVPWASSLITSLKHRGVWAVPINKTIYKIDKEEKTLTLVVGEVDQIHENSKMVFGLAGYEVKP